MTAPQENYGPPEMQEWAQNLIREANGGHVSTADGTVVADAEKRFPGRASLAMAVLMIQEWLAAGVVVPKPMDQRTEVETSDGSLAVILDVDPPSFSTCLLRRALFPTGSACEPCTPDAQAAPGQPIPKDLEPPLPDPDDSDSTPEKSS